MDKQVMQRCRRLYGDLIFQLGQLSGCRRMALARAASTILPSISYSETGSISISHWFTVTSMNIDMCCDYDYWYDVLTDAKVEPIASELQLVLDCLPKYRDCLKITSIPYTHRVCMELALNHLGEV